ncbi:hypothetical protein HanRHA438_Chr17g0802961 [Helianthus annuus]|nr:hypothetical protein HanRHA438_Chr17g0802961 [Helianthus annuus]
MKRHPPHPNTAPTPAAPSFFRRSLVSPATLRSATHLRRSLVSPATLSLYRGSVTFYDSNLLFVVDFVNGFVNFFLRWGNRKRLRCCLLFFVCC